MFFYTKIYYVTTDDTLLKIYIYIYIEKASEKEEIRANLVLFSFYL